MDPDETLSRMRALAEGLAEGEPLSISEGYELADLIGALDQWLRRGGFLPEAWKAAR